MESRTFEQWADLFIFSRSNHFQKPTAVGAQVHRFTQIYFFLAMSQMKQMALFMPFPSICTRQQVTSSPGSTAPAPAHGSVLPA